MKVCPECGKIVNNLRKHLSRGRCFMGSGKNEGKKNIHLKGKR